MTRPARPSGPPALILSGQIAGLGAVRSLGERGVPIILGAERPTDPAVGSRYVADVIDLPDPEADEEGFLATLEQPRLRGAVLMPTSDGLLTAVSRNRERLAEHLRMAVDRWSVVERFIEKRLTAEIAEAAGVPAPWTYPLSSLEDVERLAAEVAFPVLVKPSQSHRYVAAFRRKLTEVADRDELLAAYREAADRGLEVLLQELIPGTDDAGVNYNCYVVDGAPVLEFTARKMRLVPRSYGRPSALVSRHVPEAIEVGRRIIAAGGLEGYACVELKQDARDGRYRLMEVNPRINHSSILSTRAGLNFPWLIYRHLAFGERPAPQRYAQGVYWMDGSKDLARGLIEVVGGRQSLVTLLRPYARRHVFAVLDRRDPGPAVRRYVAGAGRAARSLLSDSMRRVRRTGDQRGSEA